jgi:hypothetical protein
LERSAQTRHEVLSARNSNLTATGSPQITRDYHSTAEHLHSLRIAIPQHRAACVDPPRLFFSPTRTMADEIDPTEFVQRIRQLGEQRDTQDAERVKKLEEELIQGRSERLARRAGE